MLDGEVRGKARIGRKREDGWGRLIYAVSTTVAASTHLYIFMQRAARAKPYASLRSRDTVFLVEKPQADSSDLTARRCRRSCAKIRSIDRVTRSTLRALTLRRWWLNLKVARTRSVAPRLPRGRSSRRRVFRAFFPRADRKRVRVSPGRVSRWFRSGVTAR